MGNQEFYFGHVKFSFLLNTHGEMSSSILDAHIRNSKEISEMVNCCCKLGNHHYKEVSRILELLYVSPRV